LTGLAGLHKVPPAQTALSAPAVLSRGTIAVTSTDTANGLSKTFTVN
jgi:hypothetical protein